MILHVFWRTTSMYTDQRGRDHLSNTLVHRVLAPGKIECRYSFIDSGSGTAGICYPLRCVNTIANTSSFSRPRDL